MYAAREPAGSGGSTMDDFIAELKTIDSPTLANAIELLDVRDRTDGYADLNLRCLLSQPGAMVGYAVTVTMDTTTPGPPPADKRTLELWRAVEAAPRPSVLVFQEVGPRPSIGCHGGDVMATVGRRLGCVGLVSDSGLRDIDEIRDIGLHLFARGAVVSHGNFAVRDVGVPVEVAGLRVEPGDLLHGDVNGLVMVPPELRDRLSELVERVRAAESATKNVVETSVTFGPDELDALFGPKR